MTTAESERLEPRVLARPEHSLSRRNISTDALKVLYRLHRSGYLAFLVGGAVRDLLLGRTPKDFDVATNARPQEIRRLFRNSRVIGRRFRLVHVFFKGEIVEVATFRSSPEAPEGPDDWEEAEQEAMEEEAEAPARGRNLDDEGIYGTPAEDARRRDFTVNALFYNIADYSILDYVGGIPDLEAGVIRTIGDSDARFREDPVRMMRALEYGVRMGFAVDETSLAAMERCRSALQEASSARLTYELLETLRSGSAAGIIGAWRREGIFELAFPTLVGVDDQTKRLLETVDRRMAEGDGLRDATLIGVFFLERFYSLLASMTNGQRRLDNAELLTRLRAMLEPSAAAMHLSNHLVHLLHQGLFSLAKMARPPERGRQVLKLIRQEHFSVTWDLYSFAAAAGLSSEDTYLGWARALQRVRAGEPVEPESDERPRRRSRRPRRSRRRKKK